MKVLWIMTIIIALVFAGCAAEQQETVDTQDYLLLKEPMQFMSVDEFKKSMKNIKGKNDTEMKKATEGISIAQYKLGYYFEPENIPQNCSLKHILVRDSYIGFVYTINNNISDFIPEEDQKYLDMQSITDRISVISYDWQSSCGEEGFKSFISENSSKFTKIDIKGRTVYYTELTVNQVLNGTGESKAVSDKVGATVVKREYVYLQDSNFIHVVLPGNISLKEAEKYLFVKKAFY